MDSNEISDVRTQKEFRGITFSGFKKTEVRKELLNNMYNSKIENSCYWACELICAGHFMDLWEIILYFISRHIHLGNPKLPIYIDMRFQAFKEIVQNGYLGSELSMRNNDKIRKLFSEIICVLCNSIKKHSFESIKIKDEDYDLSSMTDRLKAHNVHYIQPVYQKEDPKELFIALNELAFHVSNDSNNMVSACYWIEWIIEFENRCKKRREKCEGARRPHTFIQGKYQKDIIWIIWDVLLNEGSKKTKLHLKIIKSCLNLFGLRYTPNAKRKRKFLMYFIVSILTEQVNVATSIINNPKQIENVQNKINIIYQQVKKNEKRPGTDYLFNNKISKSNVEKTAEKLEKMKSIGNFVPRKDDDNS